MKRIASSIAVLTLLGACSVKEKGQNQPILSEQNPILFAKAANIDTSAGLDKQLSPGDPQNNDFVMINKEALGQLFLMTAAQIDSFPTPTGNDLAGKVVFFEKQGDNIYLFESSIGKVVTTSIPTKVLLTEFPILSEEGGKIKFNFKAGMNKLFYLSAMFSSEKLPGEQASEERAQLLDITKSYINKVELRGKHLYIDQYALAEIISAGKKDYAPIQLKYTFSSYVPNENFKPQESTQLQKVGFFEVQPTLIPNSGQPVINIMKYDTTKPITYFLSNNVPESYRAAVSEGILYWNKTFGKEIIKVETLPEGISVHEPGYNIVQWVDWETAGFAYANMQADPLTGEITQSHVYMTSTFASGGVKNAIKYLQKLIANTQPKPANNKINLGLKGFDSAKVCHIDYNEALHSAATEILKQVEQNKGGDLDIEAMLVRFSQDYVRETIAHEVGHTLGLRHNFAGNLGSNLTLKNYDQAGQYYFLTGTFPANIIPAATVMDYTPALPASMIGAHIRLGRDGFSYDKAAIEWGYKGGDVNKIEFGPFCTDLAVQTKKYKDCAQFDYLNNTIAAATRDYNEVTKELALNIALLYGFLAGNDAEELRVQAIEQMPLPVKASALNIAKVFAKLSTHLSKEARFVGIEFLLGGEVNDFNELPLIEANKIFKLETSKTLGGLAQMMIKDLIPVAQNFGVIEAPIITRLRSQIGLALGNLYKGKISEKEAGALSQSVAYFLVLVEREMVLKIAPVVAQFKLSERDETFMTALTAMADSLLFSKDPSDEKQLPYFEYQSGDKNLRAEVAKMMSADLFPESPSLSRNARKALVTKHQSELKIAMGEQTNTDSLSDATFDWVTKEKAVFAPLTNSLR